MSTGARSRAGRLDAARVGGVVRRVPVRVPRVDERDELVRGFRRGAGGRTARSSRRRSSLVAQRAVLQLPPHRMHHEHRILRRPGARLGAQQQVFPGSRAQRCEARVDAARVRLDDTALRFGRGFDHTPRDRAEVRSGACACPAPAPPDRTVPTTHPPRGGATGPSGRSDPARARSRSPRPGRRARRRLWLRGPRSIALDRRRGGEPAGRRRLTVELRQRKSQRPPARPRTRAAR